MSLEAPERNIVYPSVRSSSAQPPASRSRWATVILLIISLGATALLQNYSAARHHELIRNTGSTATLGNLNSFSLALLLGGLRGPLVMLLWTSSENQKHDRDLEDFDTKIELIRLLQPEFDSVHIFQIWNKAYNISVQMANLPNKYSTILDAVDYARSIDESHPNDINTLASFGQLFFDKLGNSNEKYYYASRVRKETMWREPDKVRKGDPGWRRIKLDPMLDQQGNILHDLVTPTVSRPADLPPGAEWNNGSELQYLARYNPWTYGIPPMAIGYNYFKRAQVLKDTSHQKHLQLSDLVMDNRPAVALRLWSEMEQSDAMWEEAIAFGRAPDARPIEREKMALPAAPIPLNLPPTDVAAATEAIYHFDLSARLCVDGEAEYHRHLAKFLVNTENFRSHLDALEALKLQCEADRDYLRIILAAPGEREALTVRTKAEYASAINQYKVIVLRHHVPDPVREKLGYDRMQLSNLSPKQIDAIYLAAGRLTAQKPAEDYKRVDRQEYEIYLSRCTQRLRILAN